MCGCGRRIAPMRRIMQNKLQNKPVVLKAPVVKAPVVNVPISIQRPKPQGKKINNNQRIALLNRIPPAMRKKFLK
jgi:hypothetical protein